jgi:serine/threonine protein kinase
MGGGSSSTVAKTGSTPSFERTSEVYSVNKNMYNFIKVVGKGGFGRVWKVEMKKTRQIFALKVMSKARVLARKSVQSVMSER